jgi:hypothetical protein
MSAHYDPSTTKLMSSGAALLWSLLLGVITGVACEPIVHGHLVNDDVWGRNGPGGPFEVEHLLVAGFMGLFAALLVSPVHAVALRNRPRNACMAIVYGSTITLSVIAAAAADLLCVPIAIMTSAGSAITAAVILPNLSREPGLCSSCRYRVRDLAVCPECGTVNAWRGGGVVSGGAIPPVCVPSGVGESRPILGDHEEPVRAADERAS